MFLPSLFRSRGVQSQEDELRFMRQGRKNASHPATGCGNEENSPCSSQEGRSAFSVEQLAIGPGPLEGPEENQRCRFNKLSRLRRELSPVPRKGGRG